MVLSTDNVGNTKTASRRFLGVSRAYGARALTQFQRANICVVGIGGVGSWAVETLARSGVGKLCLIDLDMIAESNVNRQIHALEGNFGKAKVFAMQERILQINPECKVTTIEDFVSIENLDTLLGDQFDVVIDAIDNAAIKASLIAFCRTHKIALISSGAAGGKTNPTHIKINDLANAIQDPLLARVRTLLRQNYGFKKGLLGKKTAAKMDVLTVYSEEPIKKPEDACDTSAGLACAGFGSAMSVTATFGLFAASYALDFLAKKAALRI